MTHELKIAPEYFEEVISGRKTFEVRKHDRPYTVGDKLILREYRGHTFSGNETSVFVTYILTDRNYCKEGFCILGIKTAREIEFSVLEEEVRSLREAIARHSEEEYD